MQSTCNATELEPQELFALADERLGEVADLVALARCKGAAGAPEVCAAINDLIDGIRTPLRRLRGAA